MSEPRNHAAGRRRTPGIARTLALMALVVGTLLGASVFTAAGVAPERVIAAQATPVAETPVQTDVCPDEFTGPGSEPWVRVELYFSQPAVDRESGTDDEFMAFLANEVTPRFPDGLTLLTGVGQWRSGDGEIGQSRSHVLIILIPGDSVAESSALVEEIRDEYETQYDQESVLRADAAAVCTSF